MGYREEMQRGSFRGEPFQARSADRTSGRRAAVTERPGRDAPTVLDMGGRPHQHRLEVFVIGDGYMADRQRLIAALNAPGVGTLIHPWLGELQVQVGEVSDGVSIGANGLASITFDCTVAGESIGLVRTVNTSLKARYRAAAIDAGGDAALEAAWYQPTRLAELNRMTAAIDGYARRLDNLRSLVEPAAEIVDKVADVRRAVSGLIGSAQVLVTEPSRLVQSLRRSLDGLRGLLGRQPQQLERAARQLLGVVPALAGADRLAVAITALAAHADTAALSWAATAIADTTWTNRAEAETALSRWVDLAEPVLATVPDALYTELLDTRAALIEDVRARAADLPALRQITLGATLPAVVVAHQLYGDATRADELVQRNRIAHPGAVPGGVTLEVLDV